MRNIITIAFVASFGLSLSACGGANQTGGVKGQVPGPVISHSKEPTPSGTGAGNVQ